MLGRILSAIIALGLVAIGVGAIVAPRTAATQYGVALDDPRADGLIRAMGVRDLAIGLVVALLLRAEVPHVLAGTMIALVPIAMLDFVVVTGDRRVRGAPGGLDRARLLHATGAVGLLLTAAVLAAGC